MYNKFSILLSFFIYVISVVVASSPTTTSLVSIDNPKPNQKLTPSQQLMLKYTVHGIEANSTSAPNYPSSLEVILRWVKNNNTQQFIQLKASGGLETDAVAGGRDKTYIHRWKLPNCRFFSRYLPSEWSFSLIFEPHYPEITSTNNITVPKHSPPLGPRQAVINVPIFISFNATAMKDRHNKRCR